MNCAVRASLSRCLLLWLLVSGSAASIGWLLWPTLPRPGLLRPGAAARPAGAVRLDELLVSGCSIAALCCALWLWWATTVVIAEAARNADAVVAPGASRRGRLLVPAVLRRALLAACGVAIVGSQLSPASAASVQIDRTGQVAVTTTLAPRLPARLLHGLPLPERAVDEETRPSTPTPPPDRSSVHVRPGDSLWSIAARDLPADATPAEITRRWQQLHHHNRAMLGADPDVIPAGVVLQLPPHAPATTTEAGRP